jgi:hypothetical protein
MRSTILIVLSAGLLISSSINAQTVTLRQIGKDNLLMSLSAYFNWRGALYSIDSRGVLYKTNLDSGSNVRIGKATWTKFKFLFGLNNKLYIIDGDGSMTEIDPVTGDWKTVSNMGEWSIVERAFVVGNSLYSIENGAFYYHRTPSATNRVQRGGSEFYIPGSFLRVESHLYSLISDGSLNEINTATGERKTIAKSKAWKNVKAAQVLGDKFYTVDVGGVLSATTLADKTEKPLDTTQFNKASILFAEAGKLYVIMKDGNLYEVKFSE